MRASPGYGSARLRLWYEGVRDRLRGEHARANARWGYLRPPPGRGKLVWVRTGADAGSVRLGAELLGAIRQHRLDLRLILSFEEAHPQIIAPRLEGMPKVAVGYGPADAPAAVRRALERLAPVGLIYAGAPARPNLLRAANRAGLRLVAYNAPWSGERGIEASYPRAEAEALAWREAQGARYVAPPANALALLSLAQVEPTLRSLAAGGRELTLHWVHGLPSGQAVTFLRAWRDSPLGRAGALLVSSESGAEAGAYDAAAKGEGMAVLRLSDWARTPVAPGSVLLIDEEHWLPAVAASCEAAHVCTAGGALRWQVLASGAALTVSPELHHEAAEFAGLPLPVAARPMDVIAHWSAFAGAPIEARHIGDACRRRFWEERRRAGDMLQELLQRVFDW
jgi:hypothetical protein